MENSRSAFAAANERLRIELDLQLSADERAMVFHDDTLDGMTSSRPGAQPLPKFGTGFKTSDDCLALRLFKQFRIGAFIDRIKDQTGDLSSSNDLERATARPDIIKALWP